MLHKRDNLPEIWPISRGISLTQSRLSNSLRSACTTSAFTVLGTGLNLKMKYKLGAVVFLACMVAGCAGMGTSGKSASPVADSTPESIVKAKSKARWDALILGDMMAVYNHLSPETRKTITLVGYGKSFRLGSWKAATVESVACEQERCKVIVKVGLKTAGGDIPIESYANEVWVKDKDSTDWWFVLK